MKNLDSRLLKKFLKLVSESLIGEWLLVGGTLLPAVGLNVRSTVDIDLIGLGEKEAAQNLELMELAEKLGLAVESINQAAAFFLNKVGYKKKVDLIPLIKGARATIFRPSVHLYWRLKLRRLTESDRLDCVHYYHFCISQNDHVSSVLLMKEISVQQKLMPSPEKMQYLLALKELLL